MSFRSLLTRLGRAIVSRGLAEGTGEAPPAPPETIVWITIPEPRPLCTITIASPQPLYTITIPRPALNHGNRLHIGDTCYLAGFEVRNSADALVDPSTFAIEVTPENSDPFTLAWGTAPSGGSLDAVIRTALGTFTVQIELSSARGVGTYSYTVTTTGARAAEPGSFRVHPLRE